MNNHDNNNNNNNKITQHNYLIFTRPPRALRVSGYKLNLKANFETQIFTS
jgi:hypothetical protein